MNLKKALIIAIIIGIALIIIFLAWIIFPLSSSSSGNEVCSCDADLDCSDFATQQQAQDCFEYCGPEDVHGLDGNNDGVVCEGLG